MHTKEDNQSSIFDKLVALVAPSQVSSKPELKSNEEDLENLPTEVNIMGFGKV